MMALGTFRFGVTRETYETFSRAAEFRWERMDRVGRAPAMQFIGPGSETVTLAGTIYPHYKGGLRQVEFMRQSAKLGAPMLLVDGLGFFWDRWVITSVREDKSLFMADGAPRKIEFRIELKSYGADR